MSRLIQNSMQKSGRVHNLLADVTDKILHHPIGHVVPVAERTHRHPAWYPLALVLDIEPLQVFAAVHCSRFSG